MTTPQILESEPREYVITDDNPDQEPSLAEAYPDAFVKGIKEKDIIRFKNWLDVWIQSLSSEFARKMDEWAAQEKAYRARSAGPKSYPFEGACGDTIPVMAMAVDPVVARLDIGVFKNDPVFSLKALKKSYTEKIPSVEQFIQYYQHHKLHLRKVVQPRFLEMTKHGTFLASSESGSATVPGDDQARHDGAQDGL